MTVKIIACEVMQEELLSITPKATVEYEFVSMGLHARPKKLQQELQKLLDQSSGYERIILAFGLCGGAAKELAAPDSPLILPHVHDCIPLLLGSCQRFEQFSREERGTFYLSSGWMLTERNILAEHQRVMTKYGEQKALRLLARMYDSYRRVLFIHTGCRQETERISESQQLAGLLKLRHETVQGDKAYLNKLVNGPWDPDEFIHIAPHETIQEEHFGLGLV